jgi:hypothetical protein
VPSFCGQRRDNFNSFCVGTRGFYSDYPEFSQSLPIKADNTTLWSVTDLHGFSTEHVLRHVQSCTHQRLFKPPNFMNI